ncbi:MAG: hypothetical protein ACM30E_01795 [Nitrososphaerales archaeon]
MSAQESKYRNRPEEDQSTRRTAEDELMRPGRGDRGVGMTGDGSTGGSGTGGGGLENEGTGSLLVNDAGDSDREGDQDATGTQGSQAEDADRNAQAGSGSTKGGKEPGVSGRRGMSSGLEKEGEGHSGPIQSGSNRPATEQDRASDGEADQNAREGYEDHGGSRDADGTQGESSGSRPGYR